MHIDVTAAHIRNVTGIDAIEKAVLKFRRAGIEVGITGLNDAGATIVDKLAVHDQQGAIANQLCP